MLVDTSVVSVIAAYSDLLCVCVVHRAGRYPCTVNGGQKNLPPPAGIRTPNHPAHGLVATQAPKFGVTVMYVIDITQNWPFKNISNP